MRQSEEIKTFKNELRNYNFYKNRISKISELLELCYYNLSGMHGVDPSKEPIATPDYTRQEMYYKISEEIERHQRNIDRCLERTRYVDSILSFIDHETRDAVVRIYANKETTAKVAKELYISAQGLNQRMNREIEKALKKALY